MVIEGVARMLLGGCYDIPGAYYGVATWLLCDP